MIKSDEHLYTLSRSEFAKSIGKSREALKQDMRRGKHKDNYIYNGKQYLFKPQETVREIKSVTMGTKVTRKINRGNHFEGKYPNDAFRKHNELKMLAKLKGVVDKEVLDRLPEAIEIAKQQKQQRIRDQIKQTVPKNYGGFNTHKPYIDIRTEWKTLFPKEKDEYDKALEDMPKDSGGYY